VPKKRNKHDIVKNKTYDGIDTRVGMNYMPPAAWKNLTNGDEESELPVLDESLLRQLISEIIKKCGDEWCLYTKHKDSKTGKKRRLGTHPSKAAAQRQERAIKYHGG
jgi:hypothetical protein